MIMRSHELIDPDYYSLKIDLIDLVFYLTKLGKFPTFQWDIWLKKNILCGGLLQMGFI